MKKPYYAHITIYSPPIVPKIMSNVSILIAFVTISLDTENWTCATGVYVFDDEICKVASGFVSEQIALFWLYSSAGMKE